MTISHSPIPYNPVSQESFLQGGQHSEGFKGVVALLPVNSPAVSESHGRLHYMTQAHFPACRTKAHMLLRGVTGILDRRAT